VLLVDDDPAVRGLLAISLKDLGCRTLTAGSGEEALRILHAKPSVDVVIAEVALPMMGGLELLCTVRQTDALEQLPFILCSVSIDEATMKKAVEYGCGRYLLKPVHPEFLFAQISSLLHRKVSRRDIPLAQA
jgi:CheY-like chemotaxis protein